MSQEAFSSRKKKKHFWRNVNAALWAHFVDIVLLKLSFLYDLVSVKCLQFSLIKCTRCFLKPLQQFIFVHCNDLFSINISYEAMLGAVLGPVSSSGHPWLFPWHQMQILICDWYFFSSLSRSSTDCVSCFLF